MTTHLYPSAIFPARPSFEMDAEDGWAAEVINGADFALVHDSDSWFRANITVTIQRFPGEAQIDAVADGFLQELGKLDESKILGQESLDVLDAPGFHTEATFTGPGMPGRLFQSVYVAAVPAGLWTDVVSVVATCTVDDTDELLPGIRSAVASIRAL